MPNLPNKGLQDISNLLTYYMYPAQLLAYLLNAYYLPTDPHTACTILYFMHPICILIAFTLTAGIFNVRSAVTLYTYLRHAVFLSSDIHLNNSPGSLSSPQQVIMEICQMSVLFIEHKH